MKDYIYIDFDGVILDSEKRMLDRKHSLGLLDDNNKEEFVKYFDYTLSHPEEWTYILEEASVINNSTEIIRELELLKIKIAILTKVHTMQEMKIKTKILRFKENINCPILFVPQGIKKHQFILPNNQLLIDDSVANVFSWINHGGRGILFDKNSNENTIEKTNSLKILLRR